MVAVGLRVGEVVRRGIAGERGWEPDWRDRPWRDRGGRGDCVRVGAGLAGPGSRLVAVGTSMALGTETERIGLERLGLPSSW